jgi:hypothetical protein
MKKAISTLALALASAVGASAQLSTGSVAPDFTLKDLNGNTHHLYDYLDQGKTVILDMSAAWCGPCWNYHKSGQLEALWKAHGPKGGNGVSASTTDDIVILMIESEATNTRAQLYGPAMAGTYATQTQGDWVTGTLYPIIDTDAVTTRTMNSNWKISYFPTMYMVCRDRLVTEIGQQSTAVLYAAAQGCPKTAASSTLDVKPIWYTGQDAFNCQASPTLRFQNYSKTQTLTSATINVYTGSTKVASAAWTGSLAPYAVGSVTIPSFTGTGFPYKYEVVATGDSYPANNMSPDSLFKVYAPGNAGAGTWSENFDASAELPYKMSTTDAQMRPFTSAVSGSTTYQVKGTNGANTRALMVGFPEYDATGQKLEMMLGNFNTSSNANLSLDFDLSYSLGTTPSADSKVDIMTSNDCGATWKSAWSKSGAALATTTHASGPFIPSKAADWRHEHMLLNAEKGANMMLKVVGTVGSSSATVGHYAFMDNFRMTNSLNVNNVIATGDVKMYPNPAKESATLELSLVTSNNVTVSVIDALGRTVSTIANGNMAQGQHRLTIPTSTLAAGVYTVNIVTEEGNFTQRLSVVK